MVVELLGSAHDVSERLAGLAPNTLCELACVIYRLLGMSQPVPSLAGILVAIVIHVGYAAQVQYRLLQLGVRLVDIAGL